MKYLLPLLLLISCTPVTKVDADAESKIREVLTQQQTAWNEGIWKSL